MTKGWDLRIEDAVAELLTLYGGSKAGAADLLCDRHEPDRVAYTLLAADMAAQELTYAALRVDSSKLAAAIWSLGLRPGDRIATLMGRSRAYLTTLMAIWRLGAVHVPLFTAFAPETIAVRLEASGCKLVVCDSRQRAKLLALEGASSSRSSRIVSTRPALHGTICLEDLQESGSPYFEAAVLGGDAPIIEIYTSGTTGKPKGVVVPMRAIASVHAYATYGLGLMEKDIFWNAADPGWAYGLYFGVLATFATGVRSVLYEGGFSAENTWEILARQRVTNFTAAPTVYRSLRASGLGPPAPLSLRRASSAGEPLTADVNEWAISALGIEVHDHYGQTETGMLINNHHHPALKRALRPGCMGFAMPGWTAGILQCDGDGPASIGEVGRLAMDLSRSPFAWFGGYAGEPPGSSSSISPDKRWYITGDLARADEEGRLYFVSRNDDVILMAGYRISPFEVECVLLAHLAVAECAVVAVPNEVRGELLEAAVVLRPGHTATSDLTRELQQWVKDRYAAHAYPRQIHYLSTLPRTPSGKVQRFMIRQWLREGICGV